LLQDLLDNCKYFRTLARNRKIVYKLNHVIGSGSLDQWNLDLVVGPGKPSRISQGNEPILTGEPRQIWLAVDAKTIMTEHGKARRNRQRDLNSLHDILHRKNRKTIVGGLVVINMSDKFKSPLRSEITVHRNIERLTRESVDLFRGLPMSNQNRKKGLDALGVIVIKHTNLQGEHTELVEGEPAPAESDSLHYSNFLASICKAFQQRFSV
jgi:hypothetical protein